MFKPADEVTRVMQSIWGGEHEQDRPAPQGRYEQVIVEKIHANPSDNSRSVVPAQQDDISGLVESIRSQGLLHPITVTPDAEGFRLVAGFRRLASVRKLEWQFVPAMVVDADPARARLLNLAENVARRDLRLYDRMRVVYLLHTKDGLSAAKIGAETNQSTKQVRTMLAVWPQLSATLKEKWSRFPDARWEPHLSQLEKWSALSRPEQDRAWNEWCCDIDEPGSDFDAFDEAMMNKRPPRRRVRNVKDVREAMKGLGKSRTEQAQRRAFLWVLGKRDWF